MTDLATPLRPFDKSNCYKFLDGVTEPATSDVLDTTNYQSLYVHVEVKASAAFRLELGFKSGAYDGGPLKQYTHITMAASGDQDICRMVWAIGAYTQVQLKIISGSPTVTVLVVGNNFEPIVNGCSTYQFSDLTNTVQTAYDGPCHLHGWSVENPGNAAKAYLHFYDALAEDVVVGTTPPKLFLMIPIQTLSSEWSADIPLVDFETAMSVYVATTVGGVNAPSSDFIGQVLFR